MYIVIRYSIVMGQSKSLVWLFMITVVLFTVGFAPYFSQEAFADTIDISSWVANDPDDGDTAYSDGDTLTLTFSANTNATNGGTMTHAEVIANFTFATPNIATGATFSGLWTSLSTLQITAELNYKRCLVVYACCLVHTIDFIVF